MSDCCHAALRYCDRIGDSIDADVSRKGTSDRCVRVALRPSVLENREQTELVALQDVVYVPTQERKQKRDQSYDSVDISLWTRHPEFVRLPNAADAVISSVKIREYLLSRKHPIGMHKASFFEALGYTEAHWRRLGEDLRRISIVGDAQRSRHNGYGQLFAVDGKLDGPSG